MGVLCAVWRERRSVIHETSFRIQGEESNAFWPVGEGEDVLGLISMDFTVGLFSEGGGSVFGRTFWDGMWVVGKSRELRRRQYWVMDRRR